jgi:hypothetical protein
MMMLTFHFKIVGLALMILALAHIPIHRHFKWKEETTILSLLTRQIFHVHTFFVALTVWMFGALTFFFTDELLQPSELSVAILLGFTIFWAIRLLVQLFVYDAALWRGKRFETMMHIIFTCFWIYCVSVYGYAFFLTIGISTQAK